MFAICLTVAMLDVVVEPCPRIGHVIVQGNAITDRRVILNLVQLKPGDRVRDDKVIEALPRLVQFSWRIAGSMKGLD